MTEDEFRTEVKKIGWSDEDIEERIDIYHWALAHGLDFVSLEDYVGPKAIITRYPSFIPITEFKDEN